MDLGGDLGHLARLLVVEVVDVLEDLLEGRNAAAGCWREVGAAEEWPPVGGEEDSHWPAAVSAGEGLHRLHVDLIEVGPLLPVDLDVDEQSVHDLGDALVLEALPLHDVAPVAGGVADAQQDRAVLRACALQGLRPPRVPVHRIVGVLEKVGTGFMDKTVGHNDSQTGATPLTRAADSPRSRPQHPPGLSDSGVFCCACGDAV